MESIYEAVLKTLTSVQRDDLIIYEGGKLSSARFLRDVDAVAGFLQEKAAKEDVITSNLPNIPNAVVTLYGVSKAGKISNIVHPLMPAAGLFAAMEKTHSKTLFTFYDYYAKYKKEIDEKNYTVILSYISDYLPHAKKLIYSALKEKKITDVTLFKNILGESFLGTSFQRSVEKTAVYLHSGGTTGTPKTIALASGALNALSKSLEYVIEDINPFHNACLSVLPLFHGFGLGVCVHTMLAHGVQILLMPAFSAKACLKNIKKYKINITAGIPRMFEKISAEAAKRPESLKSLMHTFSGGDKLPERVKRDFDAAMKAAGASAELLEGYGLTECVTVCCVSRKGEAIANCMGRPLHGIKMGIVDGANNFLPPDRRGEIVIAGETLMTGYLGGEQPFFEDAKGTKWLLTGDFGTHDKEGRFYFLGRKKRLIKISGFNVFPSEIEATAQKLPFVVQAAAVLSAEEKQIIKLFIKTDNTKTEEDAVKITKAYLQENLITYAVPREIKVIEEFPRTNLGKIDEAKLAEI